jgi:hypothetical protein
MDNFKLTQWAVTVNGEENAMFTPLSCDEETAMAIAVETFGSKVEKLVDEGAVKCSLTNEQYHIANPDNCRECGYNREHDERCGQLAYERMARMEAA